MFIQVKNAGYNADGEQFCKGSFLILARDPTKQDDRKLRAAVRQTTFRQCGQWMMGFASVKGYSIVLSGDYGQDGFAMTLEQKPEIDQTAAVAIWESMHDLPQDLQDTYWNSEGGHNQGGSERIALRKWALANLQTLRKNRKAAT